ncbi:hypothetical protein I352_05790 [Cryptococcus deuterogattii MMRL2647]|nr:hypothetical protein I352_05790 [Cryptococcus deuterogattii MMRL2647]
MREDRSPRRARNVETVSATKPNPNTDDSANKMPRRNKSGSERSQSPLETGKLKPGYLVLHSGGRSRYTESTFWACVDAEGLELDRILRNLPLFPRTDGPDDLGTPPALSNSPGVTTGIPNTSTGTSQDRMSWGPTRLAKLLQPFPSKPVCDHLFRAFMDYIHPLIPLMHIPSFESAYEEFWSWRLTRPSQDISQSILHRNPSFLPLLISVLSAGSITIHEPWSDRVGQKLRGLIPEALRVIGFPYYPSVYSLMAYILANSTLIREEDAFSSCSFVAVALRVAQSMGFHRDGTEFELDPISTEERRRVWWHLMHLDTMTSIAQGLPGIMSSSRCTTQVISEMQDEFIGKIKSTDLLDRDLWVDPKYVLAAGRYEASAQLRTILERLQEAPNITLADITPLESQIEDLRRRQSRRLDSVGLSAHSASLQEILDQLSIRVGGENSNPTPPLTASKALQQWNQALLHLTTVKAYCILYQPFMSDKEIWANLRSRALPHFQYFLALFLEMTTNPSYRPFHWLYPGSYQPLQPCAVLLSDLSAHPHSSDKTLSMQLIDRVFSLLGPTGRLVSPGSYQSLPSLTGAKQVWTVLEKLRAKVWHDLGYDHTLFWAENEKGDDASASRGSMDFWLTGNLAGHSAEGNDTSASSYPPSVPQNDEAVGGSATHSTGNYMTESTEGGEAEMVPGQTAVPTGNESDLFGLYRSTEGQPPTFYQGQNFF